MTGDPRTNYLRWEQYDDTLKQIRVIRDDRIDFSVVIASH